MPGMTIPILDAVSWERALRALQDAEIEFSSGSQDGEGQLSEYWLIVDEDDCATAVQLLQELGIESGFALGPSESSQRTRPPLIYVLMLAGFALWLLWTLPGAIRSVFK